MKTGEATCRLNHSEEWDAGRVNPCAHCYGTEWASRDIAHASVETDGDQS